MNNEGKIIEKYILHKIRKELTEKLTNDHKKKQVRSTEESQTNILDLGDDDNEKVFLTKLNQMTEKIQIYCDTFYDRDPNFKITPNNYL